MADPHDADYHGNTTTPAQVLLTKEQGPTVDELTLWTSRCAPVSGTWMDKALLRCCVALLTKTIPDDTNQVLLTALRQINDREFQVRPRYGQNETFTIAHDALNKIESKTNTTSKMLLTKEPVSELENIEKCAKKMLDEYEIKDVAVSRMDRRLKEPTPDSTGKVLLTKEEFRSVVEKAWREGLSTAHCTDNYFPDEWWPKSKAFRDLQSAGG